MSRTGLRALATDVHRGRGAAIEGEKVIAQARDIGRAIVVSGTSKHRIQQLVLTKNVLCVLDRPFRLIECRMKLKTEDSE